MSWFNAEALHKAEEPRMKRAPPPPCVVPDDEQLIRGNLGRDNLLMAIDGRIVRRNTVEQHDVYLVEGWAN